MRLQTDSAVDANSERISCQRIPPLTLIRGTDLTDLGNGLAVNGFGERI